MMREADFRRLEFDVSRETLERLEELLDGLRRWSPKINLVAPSTLETAWNRHIVDSAQLWPLTPPQASCWLDLGSGGGFPGLVIAVLARELKPELHVVMVDSDQRKCVFLSEMVRRLGLSSSVHRARVEALTLQQADVVSARALAPLDRLLALSTPHAASDAVHLYLKGRNSADELTQARRSWSMDVREHASLTDPDGVILEVRNVRSIEFGHG